MLRSRAKPRVDIPGLDVARARRYSAVQLGVLGVSVAWSLARLAWFAADKRSARLEQGISRRMPDQRLVAPVYFAATAAGSWAASLPLGLLGGYLVERAFGLSRQALPAWFGDQSKALAVGLVLQTPVQSGLFWLIRRRPRDWWLLAASAAVPAMVLLSNLAPVLLMPLFNTFTPLRDEALRVRVTELASRAGLQVADVYEMDMSRQSDKPNAMFTGLGRTRRIVLSDTMLAQFAPAEIEAVLAHEIGHQVHGDIWRLIGLGSAGIFGMAWCVAKLAPLVVRRTSSSTGVETIDDIAAYPVLACIASLLGLVTLPLQSAASRAMERRADHYAIGLTGDAAAFISAMEKLALLSLADPDPHPIVVKILYSHPPVAHRIAAARATQDVQGGNGA